MDIYPHLFSAGAIAGLSLKNRVVMPAMGTALASACGEITDHQIAYYEERARGGVGLIIFEACLVEPTFGKSDHANPRIDDHRFIPMMHRLVNSIHKHEARIFAQLHHAGAQSNSVLTGGKPIVGPSPISSPIIGETPRQLSVEEIADLEDRFAKGALRCKMAGMDGVEIHAAHGFLINQFLSPRTNQRTDDYGGCLENRARFASRIIRGIKALCGSNYPVIIRLSIDEFVDGGIDIRQGVEIASQMEAAGVDAIHVSCGTYESFPTFIEPVTYEQGWRVYLAEAVKGKVAIPVITVGVLREPATAEDILADRKADFVAIGRGLITDSQWLEKTRGGRESEIRKCVSCLYCIDNAMRGAHIGCAINTRVGRELEFGEPPKNGAGRKVVVVGGGPAGMEAARILAMRGFAVVLFEETDCLGGQLLIGSKPTGKEKLIWLVDYLKDALSMLAVDVRTNHGATVEAVLDEAPYAVFVCTGGRPVIPDIGTANGDTIQSVEKAMISHENVRGEKIAVIGAGMTGCEVAELFASNENEVFLVEMADQVAPDAGVINKMDLVRRLNRSNVHLYTGHEFIGLKETSLVLMNRKRQTDVSIKVDRIVVCLGLRSRNELYEQLSHRLDRVCLLGDASSPGRIADAIKNGFERGFGLQ